MMTMTMFSLLKNVRVRAPLALVVCLLSPVVAAATIDPLVQSISLAKDDRAELSWSITVAQEATLTQVRSDCGCLTVTTPLPLPMKPEQPYRITASVRGGLVGTKNLFFSGSNIQGRAQVQIQDPVGVGSPRARLRELLERAGVAGASVAIIAHDVRDGSPSPCQCADVPLGGADRLHAVAAMVREAVPTAGLWLSGRIDAPGPENQLAELLAGGWTKAPPAAVLVSQRPHVAVRKNPAALIIPQGAPAGGHQRILDPWPGMGASIVVVIRKPNGAIDLTQTILLTGDWR
jgi:hypothetical protein